VNISGLVVRARPDACAAVCVALERMPGLEVTASEAGRIVVVTDHDGTADAADTFVAIRAIEGVLSVSLVYQYGDDTPVPEEVEP
jgi:nitrate reductase NapD